jgi:hypothetical protein
MKTTQYKLQLIACLLLPLALAAQDLKKVVFVEGAFRPEVQDAEKFGYMPSLTDTAKIAPEINYSVIPSHLQTNYSIKPIKPAKLVGSSLDELYKSQLKLGVGNYTTPLAEYSIHNLRSKEYAVGAYLFHRSSHAKMEMPDNNYVPAGYGKNRLNIYGKRFYHDVNADGEIYLSTDKYRFYGYNTSLTPDTALEAKDINQFYTQVGGRATVYSTIADSGKFQYKLGLDANYFGDDYHNRENHLHIPGMAEFNIQSFRLEVDAGYHLFSARFDTAAQQSRHIIQIHPVLKKRSNLWEVKLGANTFYSKDIKGKFYFYPEAQLKFTVVEKILDAYVGVNGKLELNNLSKIAGENPYIKPGLIVSDTRHKMIGYAGLQGMLSSKAGYKANVSFNSVENAYFFVNDTASLLQNQFIARSDKLELVKFQGELWYSPLSFLDFYWTGSYSSFTMTNEAEPWHIPAFDMSFSTAYNIKEKIFARFDLINYGKRYAYNWQDTENPIELTPVWDLNLKTEYKYSNVLSAFLDLNNLLAKQYYLWNQYPTQKFNLILGISYKF